MPRGSTGFPLRYVQHTIAPEPLCLLPLFQTPVLLFSSSKLFFAPLFVKSSGISVTLLLTSTLGRMADSIPGRAAVGDGNSK